MDDAFLAAGAAKIEAAKAARDGFSDDDLILWLYGEFPRAGSYERLTSVILSAVAATEDPSATGAWLGRCLAKLIDSGIEQRIDLPNRESLVVELYRLAAELDAGPALLPALKRAIDRGPPALSYAGQPVGASLLNAAIAHQRDQAFADFWLDGLRGRQSDSAWGVHWTTFWDGLRSAPAWEGANHPAMESLSEGLGLVADRVDREARQTGKGAFERIRRFRALLSQLLRQWPSLSLAQLVWLPYCAGPRTWCLQVLLPDVWKALASSVDEHDVDLPEAEPFDILTEYFDRLRQFHDAGEIDFNRHEFFSPPLQIPCGYPGTDQEWAIAVAAIMQDAVKRVPSKDGWGAVRLYLASSIRVVPLKPSPQSELIKEPEPA